MDESRYNVNSIAAAILRLAKKEQDRALKIFEAAIAGCSSKEVYKIDSAKTRAEQLIYELVKGLAKLYNEEREQELKEQYLTYLNYIINKAIVAYDPNKKHVLTSKSASKNKKELKLNYIIQMDKDQTPVIVNAIIQACILKDNHSLVENIILQLMEMECVDIRKIIINAMVEDFISQGKSIDYINSLFFESIKGKDLKYVTNIITALNDIYIEKAETTSGIVDLISKFIQANPSNVINIVNGTVRAYIKKEKTITEVVNLISKLIEKNPRNIADIVNGTVQAYIEKNSIDEISSLISELEANKCTNTYMYDIVNAAVLTPLLLGETIQKALIIFHQCRVGLESLRQTDKIKPFFPLILSKYLMNILINDKKRDSSTEFILLIEFDYFTGSQTKNLNEINSKNLLELYKFIPKGQLDTIYFNKIPLKDFLAYVNYLMEAERIDNIGGFLNKLNDTYFVKKFESPYVIRKAKEITKQKYQLLEAMSGASSELGEKTQTLEGVIPSRNPS